MSHLTETLRCDGSLKDDKKLWLMCYLTHSKVVLSHKMYDDDPDLLC